MNLGPVLYWALLVILGFSLVVFCAKRDRTLGLIVALTLVVRITGALAMGVYLQEVRGRDFLAEDEPGYQMAALQALEQWRAGVPLEQHELSISGGYTYWNALVIVLWGSASLLPMRLANVMASTLSVALAYLLAYRLFLSKRSGRIAAILVAIAPSSIVWSLTNLKESFLALGILGSVLFGVLVTRKVKVVNIAGLILFLGFLGSIRRFYAAVLGWVILAGYLFLSRVSLPRRIAGITLLTLLVGAALYVVSGSPLGLGVTQETIVRFILSESPDEGSAEYVSFPPDLGIVARNIPAVLFGGFELRGQVGQLMAALLLPEWVATFLLLPLALRGLVLAMRLGCRDALLPAGFILVMIMVLAWIHGDSWTTLRFKATFWPLVLVFSAGGITSMFAPRTEPRLFRPVRALVTR